jgi:hypothetical protein
MLDNSRTPITSQGSTTHKHNPSPHRGLHSRHLASNLPFPLQHCGAIPPGPPPPRGDQAALTSPARTFTASCSHRPPRAACRTSTSPQTATIFSLPLGLAESTITRPLGPCCDAPNPRPPARDPAHRRPRCVPGLHPGKTTKSSTKSRDLGRLLPPASLAPQSLQLA